MRINEQQLKQIVEEETKAVLQEQLLNEGLLNWLWGVLTDLPSGVIENIKEWMGGRVLSMIGFQANTPAYKIGVNFFGNLTMEDVTGIMSGSKRCEDITRELSGAITEYIIEGIPSMFGFKMDGWISGAIREALGTKLLAPLNQGISQGLCNIDFMSLFGGKGDEEKGAVAEGLIPVDEARAILLEKFGDDASILEEDGKK